MAKHNTIKKNCPFRSKLPCKNGVAILEYMIVSTAVVSILVVFLGPLGIFQKAFSQTLSTGSQGMMDMASQAEASWSKGSKRPPSLSSADSEIVRFYRDAIWTGGRPAM